MGLWIRWAKDCYEEIAPNWVAGLDEKELISTITKTIIFKQHDGLRVSIIAPLTTTTTIFSNPLTTIQTVIARLFINSDSLLIEV